MSSLPMMRFASALAALLFSAGALQAEPKGALSSKRSEGIIITTLEQPEFFIFQSGANEEHFDGTLDAMESQGGVEVGEPITGLRYIRPRLSVDGAPWTAADKKILDEQFHAGSTANFYLFKTAEGQLFYLPKAGETPVVRVDYFMPGGRKVTVWARK